jgi:hypothetical protein
MIKLYSASSGGAQSFEVLEKACSDDSWAQLKEQLCQLLDARNQKEAKEILQQRPFYIYIGTNDFNDEFCVLHAKVSIDEYVNFERLNGNREYRCNFAAIANAIETVKIGIYIRFASVGIDPDPIVPPVKNKFPTFTTEVVERALKDCEQLMISGGATSAFDRAHTALHGYINSLCTQSDIAIDQNSSITAGFAALKGHPNFQDLGPYNEITTTTLKSLSKIVDKINFLRNNASVAHPNDTLLPNAEGMLYINTIRTIIHYLDSKMNSK